MFFDNTRKPVGIGGKIMVNIMNRGHASLSNWGFTFLSPIYEEKVLDIGCGGGANIAKMLEMNEKAHVTGVDYSEVSVDKSKKVNQKAIASDRCEVLQGNVQSLPFEDETFELVTAFETVYFWPTIENSFKEVHRIMKSGGRFFICNESDGEDKASKDWEKKIEGMKVYTKEEIVTALERAGFHAVTVHHDKDRHRMCFVGRKG